MKLSPITITILENCAKFNNHILLMPGKFIQTVNEKKVQQLVFEGEDDFPIEVPLADLSGFLKVIKMFDEPDFDWQENCVIISDKDSTQQYFYGEKEELIVEEKRLQLPTEPAVVFKMTDDHLKRVLKAAATNGHEDIIFSGENGNVFIKSADKTKMKKVYSITTGETCDIEFTAYTTHAKKGFRLDMLPLDYQVSICKENIIRFEAQLDEFTLTYTMALAPDSVFE